MCWYTLTLTLFILECSVIGVQQGSISDPVPCIMCTGDDIVHCVLSWILYLWMYRKSPFANLYPMKIELKVEVGKINCVLDSSLSAKQISWVVASLHICEGFFLLQGNDSWKALANFIAWCTERRRASRLWKFQFGFNVLPESLQISPIFNWE